jgi:putative transposase
MPQEREMDLTVCRLFFHIIFATEGRREWIEREWRAELHEQLSKIIWSVGSYPEAVGGFDDHVHLVVRMRDSYSLDAFVKMVKEPSAEWVRKTHEKGFAWEEDYAVFSLGPEELVEARRYVSEEADRHLTMDSLTELKGILDSLEIDYDEDEL